MGFAYREFGTHNPGTPVVFLIHLAASRLLYILKKIAPGGALLPSVEARVALSDLSTALRSQERPAGFIGGCPTRNRTPRHENMQRPLRDAQPPRGTSIMPRHVPE